MTKAAVSRKSLCIRSAISIIEVVRRIVKVVFKKLNYL